MHTLILSEILLAAWYLDWRLHRTFIIRILVWKLLPHLRSLVAVKIVFPCFSLVLILQFQHPSYHVFKLNLHSISLVNLPQISFLKKFLCPFSLIIIGKLGNNTQTLNLSLEIYVTSLIRKGRKLWINRTKHINNKYCWKKNLCNGWKCKLYPCMETTLEMRSRHTNIPTKSDQSADLNNKRCPKCRKRCQF